MNVTAVQLFGKRVCKAYKYALFCIFTVCLEFLRAYFNLCSIILSPKKWHSSPFFRPQFDVWILTRPTCISNDIRFYFRSFRYGYYFDIVIKALLEFSPFFEPFKSCAFIIYVIVFRTLFVYYKLNKGFRCFNVFVKWYYY